MMDSDGDGEREKSVDTALRELRYF